MLSILICSPDSSKYNAVTAMYATALASEPHEFIRIDDAKSLAEGYNRAVARAKGDVLIFSHDDIEILSPDFPRRLYQHLTRFDLVGVAGTTRLIRPIWPAAGPPYVFGQIAHPLPDGNIVVDVYGAPHPSVGNIQALDGLFIAAKRSVLDQINFDAATFDGFHLYDVDFSFQAYRAGFKIGVACDINLFHRSFGKFESDWQKHADRFEQKWARVLPPAKPRAFQWSAATVPTKAHALQVMSPTHWSY